MLKFKVQSTGCRVCGFEQVDRVLALNLESVGGFEQVDWVSALDPELELGAAAGVYYHDSHPLSRVFPSPQPMSQKDPSCILFLVG